MALILSLDTSTNSCSAALHDEGKLLISADLHVPQAHGSKLAPLIKNLFEISGIEFSSLKAVALTSGPGSYTGLRIGTSTAKGICFAFNIPLISFNVLSLLAFQARKSGFTDGLLCPMIDARRMEVYCSLIDSNGSEVLPMEAKVIDETSFGEQLQSGKVYFFGNGAEKCQELIRNENAVFLSGFNPSAAVLGEMAFGKYGRNEFEDLVHFEPVYLKEFLVKKSTKLSSVLNN